MIWCKYVDTIVFIDDLVWLIGNELDDRVEILDVIVFVFDIEAFTLLLADCEDPSSDLIW